MEVKTYRAHGHDGMVIVPTVYGRTAAASVKTTARRTPDRAALLARSAPATVKIIDLVEGLAVDLGLVVQETPSGVLLKTPGLGSVANVYLADYDSVDIPLKPLRDRGWIQEADSLLAGLQGITRKRLTEKTPTLPTADALAHWEELQGLLGEIANLHLAVGTGPGATAPA